MGSSSVTMSLYDVKVAIPVLLTAGYLLHSYLSYRRLSHIPGPLLAAWSNLWLVGVVWRKQSHLEFYETAQKYGSIARIGPNTVITSDVDLMRRMSAARSPYKRSDWYRAMRFEPGVDHVFSMLNESDHTRRRAQMTNGYLGRENMTIEPSIDRNVLNLLDLIRRKYTSSASEFRPMDLAEKAHYFTLDTVMDIATGAPIGDLEQDEDVFDYLKSTAISLPPLAMAISVPAIQNFLQIPFLARRLFPNANDELGLGRIIGITRKKVAERFVANDGNKVVKPDMLQSFIRHGLTQTEAVSESLIQILGGSDTTATAIRVIMLNVITSRHVYTTLQTEIDEAIANKKISSPVVSDAEARALPYLQAVIREGLRIYPPATGLASKVVPPAGDTINGIFLPGGTKVGANYWALMRRTDVFGQDATIFRPERWLDASPEQLAKMEKVQELVWGYGKYVCLGRSVALVELNKISVELIRNFDWTLVDPTRPWKSACYAIFVMSDMWVRVTERKKDAQA